MRDIFRGESHHALVHRLDRIGDDVADRVGEGFLVDVDLGQVAGEKIFGPDHGTSEDRADGFLHGPFEGHPDLRQAPVGRDGEHLLDEVTGALEGTFHFIQANGNGVVGTVEVFRDGEIADDIGQNLVEVVGHSLDQTGRRGLGRSEGEGFRQLFVFRHVNGHQQDRLDLAGGIEHGDGLGLEIDPAAVLLLRAVFRLLGGALLQRQVQRFGRAWLVVGMDARERIGAHQLFRRVTHHMAVGRVRPGPVAQMVEQDNEVRHVAGHDLEEPPLLAPFDFRLGPLLEAAVTAFDFLPKLLEIRFLRGCRRKEPLGWRFGPFLLRWTQDDRAPQRYGLISDSHIFHKAGS